MSSKVPLRCGPGTAQFNPIKPDNIQPSHQPHWQPEESKHIWPQPVKWHSGTEDTVYRTVTRFQCFLKTPLGFPRSSYPKFADEIWASRHAGLVMRDYVLLTRLVWTPEKRIERPSCWAEVTVDSQLIWPRRQISNLAWWPKALPSEQAAGGHVNSVDMPCFACNCAARMANHA